MTRQSNARLMRRTALRNANRDVNDFVQGILLRPAEVQRTSAPFVIDELRAQPPAVIYGAYLEFCERKNRAPLKDHDLYRLLAARGYDVMREGAVIRWESYRLAAFARVQRAADVLGVDVSELLGFGTPKVFRTDKDGKVLVSQ